MAPETWRECSRERERESNCSVTDYLTYHHLFLSYILGAVETIGTMQGDENNLSYTFNTLLAMGITVVLTVTVGVGVK